MQWSAEILDTLIAPEISEFTNAQIPDLREGFPEASFWPVNYFLNVALGPKLHGGWKPALIGYLRRAHNAFDAYHKARDLTTSYLLGHDPTRPRLSQYYDSLSAWEEFALQSSMAIDLFRWMNKNQGAFEKRDGSPEQRIYELANMIKHTASCIRSGQCIDSDTVPLWLTNRGLSSFGQISVTFEEAAEVTRNIARLADILQHPYSGINE